MSSSHISLHELVQKAANINKSTVKFSENLIQEKLLKWGKET